MARSSKKQQILDTYKKTGFIGTYELRLYLPSFRIVLPAEFRYLLDDTVIMTKGFNNTLVIIPPEKWEFLIDPIKDNMLFKETSKDLLRYLVGSSYIVNIGKQGRLVIPQQLRINELKQNDKLVVVGMLNFIEIWPYSLWNKKQKQLGKQAKNLTSLLTQNQM